MNSKVQSHISEINYIKSIIPVSKLIIETASFDIHKLTNPEVTREDYQNGRQKGFYNTKAYVFSRDKYTCQKCKKKDVVLNVHHIIFRSHGGTDSPDNLVTLCKECHKKLHNSKNPEKNSLKLVKKVVKNTKDSVQVSTVSAFLRKLLVFEEAFGYETKYNRERLGLPKAHFVDALCVGLKDNETVKMPDVVFKKVRISNGDYAQTDSQPNKNGITPKIPRGKIFGFRRFDRVEYFGTVCFIKGRMSTGYAVLINIDEKKLSFGHIPKFELMKRIGARKSCLIDQKRIESFDYNTISYSVPSIEKYSSKEMKLKCA